MHLYRSACVSLSQTFSLSLTASIFVYRFFLKEGRKKLSVLNNPTYSVEYSVLTFRPTHETTVECRARNSLGEYKAEIQIIAPKGKQRLYPSNLRGTTGVLLLETECSRQPALASLLV